MNHLVSLCIRILLIKGFLIGNYCIGHSQLPTSSFTLSENVCVNAGLIIENNSTGGSTYEWDFCLGDLNNNPVINSLGLYSELTRSNGMDLVEYNGNYYLFVVKQSTSTLYRLDFGSNINAIPVINNLGNPNNSIVGAYDIEIVNHKGIYYGFIASSSGNVALITFDNGIGNNVITGINLGNFGDLTSNLSLEVESDNFDIYLFLTSSTTQNLKIIRFEDSPSGLTTSRNVNIPGSGQLCGVAIFKEGDRWYAFLNSVNIPKIWRVDFGNDPLDVAQTKTNALSISSPISFKLHFLREGNNYFILNHSFVSGLVQFNFGDNLLNPSPIAINHGKIGNAVNLIGESLIFTNSEVHLFSLDYTNSQLYHINYPNICSSDISASQDAVPVGVNYSSKGSNLISLKTIDTRGNSDVSVESVMVLSNPIAQFSSDFNCSNTNTLFKDSSSSENGNISTWSWDFNGLGGSAIQNPTFQFPSEGNYNVQLNVEDDYGCKSSALKIIRIYPENDIRPEFNFDPLVCSEGLESFFDASSFVEDVPKSWRWNFNGDEGFYTTKDVSHEFINAGNNIVLLTVTGISGCSYSIEKTIATVPGPPISFTLDPINCKNEVLVLEAISTGDIIDYSWDLGDGTVKFGSGITHAYEVIGSYEVLLKANAANGCTSTFVVHHDIFSKPLTNFSIDLPPFSCSNTPSQFNDLTPPMPDSNITSWQWTFGDPSNGSSSQRNPSFTYALAGNYDVSLTTTSNFGCTNSLQKTVTIFPSPQADFSFGTACVNQDTQFTDLSTGDIKSWLWSMPGSTYSEQNPKHKFLSASTHGALLTVTGNNNCISQASKNVFVPIPIIADFTSTTTCATKPALFDEINKGGTDPAVSWTWNFDIQGSATGSPAQHVFSSIGNYSVTMNTTRQSGCTYSVTKTIPIVESPTAQFTTSREAGGAPLKVDFTNTSLNATNYYWKFGDAANTTSAQFSPSFTYTGLGEFNAELTAINTSLNCEDSYSQLITVVIPLINATLAEFRLTEITGGGNLSPIVTIENKSNVDLMNTEVYLDLSGSSLIHENIGAVIKPNESYAYTFTQSIAPRTLSYVCAEVKVDGDEYAFDNRQCINLLDEYVSQVPYPNPANSELMLEWINVVDEPMHLVIYNASGQSIISRQYSPTLKGLNQVKLDVSGLSAGIYFVSYVVNGQTQNFKFSIIR